MTKKNFDALDSLRARDVKLPDGRAISSVPAHEMKRIALELGVPGVDGSTGHQAVADLYCNHLQAIYARAGQHAVEAWLAAVRQPARLYPARAD